MKFFKKSTARVLVGSMQIYSLPCTVCGTVTAGTRRKKYCGPACRVKAARYRKKEGKKGGKEGKEGKKGAVATPFASHRENALADQTVPAKPLGLSSASARRLAGARASVKGNCQACGREFKGTTRRRFCSSRCRLASFRQLRKALATTVEPGQ